MQGSRIAVGHNTGDARRCWTPQITRRKRGRRTSCRFALVFRRIAVLLRHTQSRSSRFRGTSLCPSVALGHCIPLPKGWTTSVKSGVIHAIALAHYAIVYSRSWAADSRNERVRLKAKNLRARPCCLLERGASHQGCSHGGDSPHRRPQYPPPERMAILELKASRGWSLEQTAKAFFVTAATISSWMKRLDEDGPDALVQTRESVNRFPDFVRYVVQRLKTLCPTMGKVKIAETLARAGLHLGSTSVGRMLKEKHRRLEPPDDESDEPAAERVVTAKYPNHVWHVDLTTVPTGAGFWTSWLPFALPQCWPFCWWVAVVIDHFSHRVMGTATFKSQPTSKDVRGFLGRAIARAKKGAATYHLRSRRTIRLRRLP